MNASFVNWITSQLLICVTLTTLSLAAVAEAKTPDVQKHYTFDLPQQSVADSLNDLAKYTGAQFLFPFQLAQSKTAKPITGHFTLLEATAQLLQNTGLKSDLVDGVLTISPADDAGTFGNQNHKGKKMNTYTRKTLLASMVGLFAAGGASGSLAQGGEAATEQGRIDEILVTATRREASLNDTAVSIAAIGGEEISRRSLTEMNDYLRIIPGVNFADRGASQNSITMRGLTLNSAGSPSTGVYLGEVSLGGLALAGSSDLRMIDLERVEVLRGPQGTLYGSSSLAGAIRNIPVAPDLSEINGSIKTSYSNTAKAGGDNTKIEGVVNVPLIDDVLGIRAVVYRHDNSGFVKNIAGTQLASNGLTGFGIRAGDSVAAFGGAELYQDRDDVGQATYTGGRIAMLWSPSDELDVTLQYITQDVEQEGWPYEQLNLGEYNQVSQQFGNNVPALVGEEQGLDDDIAITNLVAEYDFGWATLLSSTAWIEEDSARRDDLSYFLFGLPVAQPWESTVDVFTQELRLVSQLDGAFQYIIGVYYDENEEIITAPAYATADLSLSFIQNPIDPTDPQLLDQFFDRSTEQLSFYGELSYKLSDQLTLTGGARHFDYERTQHYFLTGAVGESDSTDDFDETGSTLKVNLSYQPNDETLIYAQWVEGFRLGDVVVPPPLAVCDVNNDGLLDGTNTPIRKGYESDTLESFEIGAKFTLLDNRLQVNTSIYDIDWQGIPLNVIPGPLPGQAQTCQTSITANAGEARSQGIEIEAVYQITQNLQVNAGGAYIDAELTAIDPDVAGTFFAGDRLPGAPRSSINVGLEYSLEIGGYDAYIRGDYAYTGEYFGAAGETGGLVNPAVGDYGQLDMSAGITLDQFTLELIAKNLTDEEGLLYASSLGLRGETYRLRPRTIGLSASYQF